ncbi:MAG: nuclear transport factor 2 family protein [Nannocystales bacterium]
MTMTQPEARTAWEAYAAIWKLTGPQAKRSACAQALDDGCVYTDPITQRKGWDALVEYMVEFHQQVPGGHFVTTDFKAHNGRSVASWNMVGGDGSVLGTGISYGEYSDSGKVRTMTGFFETPEQP